MDEPQPAPPDPEADDAVVDAVDEAEEESFPSSDPQSSWAGPDDVVGDGATDPV